MTANVCVASVVSEEAGPQLRSDDGDSLCDVGEDGPALVGHVLLEVVEEIVAVNGFMASD